MRVLYFASFESPIGELWLLGDGQRLLRLKIGGPKERFFQEVEARWGLLPKWSSDALSLPLRELKAYFRGELQAFTTALSPQGTPFQRRVWEVTRRIPYGQVKSYGEVAQEVGSPGGGRAVGRALGANPLPLFIPCHRVVKADGSLGGFSSGLWVKQWLLQFEGVR